MNAERFDSLSRLHALSISRRSLGAGGLAAALSRLVSPSVRAQFDNGEVCRFEVRLTSSVTPGAVADATMDLEIQEDGAIDAASFTLGSEQPIPLVGQVVGRSIDLLVTLPDGTDLSMNGLADSGETWCNSTLRGFLSNPEAGQLGT